MGLGFLSAFPSLLLLGFLKLLSADALFGDEALDLWCLIARWLAFFLDLTTDNVSTDVITVLSKSALLEVGVKTEQLADLRGTFGSQALGARIISEIWDGLVSLLGNDQAEDSDIMTNNASPDTLSLAETGPALTEN